MFSVPALPYGYADLEPTIDEATMHLHHDKHHQAYVDKLNAAVEKYSELAAKDVETLLKEFDQAPEDIKMAVRNHGGGHANHSLFWTVLSPEGGEEPTGELAEALTTAFGSFSEFKKQFETATAGQFGSGWGWLVIADGALKIITTANQDSPLMNNQTPIFGVDVWEHAYYLKYQNKRPDYLAAIWQVVNWQEVDRRYQAAKS